MTVQSAVAVIIQESATLGLLLSRQLQGLGFAVEHVQQAAMELPLQPAPDLICLELLYSNGNGFKLLRCLAAHHHCPRLLFTDSGHSSDQNWGLRAGATAVLTRPYCLAQLQPYLPPACQEQP